MSARLAYLAGPVWSRTFAEVDRDCKLHRRLIDGAPRFLPTAFEREEEEAKDECRRR